MDEQRMRKADQMSRDALHIRMAQDILELHGHSMKTQLYRSLHDMQQRLDNEAVAIRISALDTDDDA